MLKGIDISVYQGEINWERAKPQIDFAILRCGLGDDIPSQDDKYFERNYSECIRLGIPFAVYFFSYAINKAKVATEIAHIKRLLDGKKITAPVYIDVENTKGLDWRTVSNEEMLAIMQEFNAQLNALGYKMGIYSSRSAFWNEKMVDPWYDNISKWVAEYGDKVNNFDRTYDIWQHTSSGKIDGINGNVDMNIMYNSIFTEEKEVESVPQPICPAKKSNDEIAQEVMNGTWGNGEDRKNRLTAAGYDYNAIQTIVNELAKPKPVLKSNEEIAQEVLAGKWGNGEDRKQKLMAAGYDYNTIQSIVNDSVKASTPNYVTYTVKRGDTLSKIASVYGTTYQKIAKDNGIVNPNKIFVGQQLKIYR